MYSCAPSKVSYCMSKALAKFCPRLCTVPDCRVRLSGMMTSKESE